ncbi:MAG: PorV/PorQ family protein [bacterium]|nr:PorV/PorQ family protein [bacterium]
MKIKVTCLLAILLLVTGMVSTSYADISNAAVLFLRIAPGARAAGMGEAFVAIADDATATHYNPAGLGAYPLSNSSIETNIPAQYRPIKSLAALRSGKGSSVEDYEIWAITSQGLLRSKAGKWSAGEVQATRTDQTVAQLTTRYYNVTNPDELPALIDKVAAANNRTPKSDVQGFRDAVIAMAPSDYSDRAGLEQSLDSILEAWSQVRINWDRFAEAQSIFNDAKKDSALTARETERIQFAVERSRNRFIPEEVTFPFSVKLSGEPTVLTSQDNLLIIGTTAGMVRYNGKNWQTFTTEGGLPSDSITCLRTFSSTTLIGTTAGMAKFNGLTIEPFDTSSAAPIGRVSAMSAGTGNELFAVVDADLYRFDGVKWSNTFPYTVLIDDTSAKIAAKYTIYGSPTDLRRFEEKYRAANVGMENLNNPGPGTVINVPYLGILNGEVSSVLGGIPGQSVWIGTDQGVIMMTRDGWQMPGYREYTADSIMTIAQVAALRKDLSGTTLAEYTEGLKVVNDLPEGIIPPGRTVLIHKNAASSPVTSIDWYDEIVYVGTEAGLLEYSREEWRRSDFRGLGDEPSRRVSMVNSQLWAASDRRMVTGASAHPEISTMYVKWLPELADDLYYTYFSGVFPVGSIGGTVGLSTSFISYGTITRTGENAEDLGTFDAFDFAFQGSYGTSLTNKLKGGLSAKFLWSHLAEQGAAAEKGKGTSYGFALDFGLLYHASDKLNLGMALTNLGPKMTYIDANQADDLPRNLSVGAAYKLLRSRDTRVTVTAEYNKMMVGLNDSFTDELLKEAVFNGGVEATFLNLISGRFGYVYDEEGDVKVWTLGAGINALERFRFDVAYIPSGESVALANITRFSLSILL